MQFAVCSMYCLTINAKSARGRVEALCGGAHPLRRSGALSLRPRQLRCSLVPLRGALRREGCWLVQVTRSTAQMLRGMQRRTRGGA